MLARYVEGSIPSNGCTERQRGNPTYNSRVHSSEGRVASQCHVPTRRRMWLGIVTEALCVETFGGAVPDKQGSCLALFFVHKTCSSRVRERSLSLDTIFAKGGQLSPYVHVSCIVALLACSHIEDCHLMIPLVHTVDLSLTHAS